MNGKQFRKYLDRDGGCVHCGDPATSVPHHRKNRGMGGSKLRDVPSNIVAICALLNGEMESNPHAATAARANGWKLESWQDPATTPVWYPTKGGWFVLGDDFTLTEVGGQAA